MRVRELAALPWTAGLAEEALVMLAIEEAGLHLAPVNGYGDVLLPFRGRDLARATSELRRLVSGGAVTGPGDALDAAASVMPEGRERDACRRLLASWLGGHDALGLAMALGVESVAVAGIVPEGGTVTLAGALARLAAAMPNPPGEAFVRRMLSRYAVEVGSDVYARRLPERALAGLADACVAIVAAASPGRRWRAPDLAARLGADPVALGSALSTDGRLIRVHGDTWCDRRDPAHAGTIHATMEAILDRRGGPMATADLVSETRRLWGDDTAMQPRIWGRMVNVRRGAWGLAGRDLVVPEGVLRDLVAHAEASLAAGTDLAAAIHAALPAHLAPLLADDCALASALHPAGFRLARGFRLRDARAGHEASPDSIVGRLREGLRRNPGGLTIAEAYALAAKGADDAPMRKTVERMLAFCARRSVADAMRWVLRDPSADVPAKPPSVRDPRFSGQRVRKEARGALPARGAIWTEEAVATIERMLAEGKDVEAIRDVLGDGVAIGNLVTKINRLGLSYNTCRVPGRSRRLVSPGAGA